MASKLNPYLQFKDNAREAMTYYQDVFGGDLVVNTFGEYGGERRRGDALPARSAQRLHADGVRHPRGHARRLDPAATSRSA